MPTPADHSAVTTRRDQRAELAARLEAEGDTARAATLTRCAETLTVTCICCRRRKDVERGCRRRWCPVCGPRVAHDRYWRKVGTANLMRWPLSVVLTERSRRTITGAVTDFKAALRDFRRTRFWSDNVKGGVQSVEITHTPKGWHVHAHLLLDCRWLAVNSPEPQRGDPPDVIAAKLRAAQAELSTVWGAYIGQRAAIVWVKRAFGDAAAEALKYSVKATDLLKARKGLRALLDEIDRGRLMTTFGNCHAASAAYLGKQDIQKPPSRCDECGARRSYIPADLDRKWHERPELMPALMIQRYARLAERADAQRQAPELY